MLSALHLNYHPMYPIAPKGFVKLFKNRSTSLGRAHSFLTALHLREQCDTLPRSGGKTFLEGEGSVCRIGCIPRSILYHKECKKIALPQHVKSCRISDKGGNGYYCLRRLSYRLRERALNRSSFLKTIKYNKTGHHSLLEFSTCRQERVSFRQNTVAQ